MTAPASSENDETGSESRQGSRFGSLKSFATGKLKAGTEAVKRSIGKGPGKEDSPSTPTKDSGPVLTEAIRNDPEAFDRFVVDEVLKTPPAEKPRSGSIKKDKPEQIDPQAWNISHESQAARKGFWKSIDDRLSAGVQHLAGAMERRRKRKRREALVAFAVLFLFFGALFSGFIYVIERFQKPATQVVDLSNVLQDGAFVRVTASRYNWRRHVPMAPNPDTINEYFIMRGKSEWSYSDDIEQLKKYHGLVLIDKSTSAQVLEYAPDSRTTKIKLLEGEHNGRVGYVLTEDLLLKPSY